MQTYISIQGYQGSFHHQVALQTFGRTDMQLLERDTFAEVYADVEEKRSEYGIAALTNVVYGDIQESQALLTKYQPRIMQTIVLPVIQHLIGIPGAKLEDITTVYSHSVALKQCQLFLAQHPVIKAVATTDTAKSVADIIQKGDPTHAAIAGELAAQLYGGELVAQRIQDRPDNTTTFIVFKKEHA